MFVSAGRFSSFLALAASPSQHHRSRASRLHLCRSARESFAFIVHRGLPVLSRTLANSDKLFQTFSKQCSCILSNSMRETMSACASSRIARVEWLARFWRILLLRHALAIVLVARISLHDNQRRCELDVHHLWQARESARTELHTLEREDAWRELQ